jgi:nitrogen fixation protein NifU and related proteins
MTSNGLDHDRIGGESMYRDDILEHARTPANSGTLPDATFMHHETNTSCGDTIDMYVKLEGDVVSAVKWQGQGCAISQAAASMLSESIKGMTVKRLAALTQKDVEALLGFPVGLTRVRCALLGLRTVQEGLQSHAGVYPKAAPAAKTK